MVLTLNLNRIFATAANILLTEI